MKIAPAILGSSLLFFFALSARADEEAAPALSPARSFLDRTVVLDDVVGGLYPVGVPTGAVLTVAWLTFGTSTSKSFGSDSTTTTYGLAPSADFFVGPPGLSIGGRIELFHIDQRSSSDVTSSTSSSTTRSFAPRVGWAFPVTDFLVLWPRVELEFGSGDSKSSSTGTPDRSSHNTRLQASGELSMVFPIQRHVSFSFGPVLAYSSATSDDTNAGDSKLFYVAVRGAMRLAF